MEAIELAVETRKSLTLPWEETTVLPIGDVQLGSQGVAVDKLRRHIEWGVKHNAYFLGMGDYVDVMSPSNRETWRSARMYDSVREAMATAAEARVQEFLKLVKGTAGRWLGVLEGHHYYDFEDGTTSDTRIAQALGTTFLGTCAYVRLVFARSKSRLKCVIWAHHGAGSGVMPHSPLARLYHVMGNFEADIYLMGHQTKKAAAPHPRIYMSDVAPYQLVAKKKILAGTGGWAEGYQQGRRERGVARGSYVERGMMGPTALGGIVLRIRPVHSGTGGDRLDLNCEV